jgi:hypothetical protein
MEASAQDFKSDIIRINKAYAALQDYSMELTYNLYANPKTTIASETQKAKVCRSTESTSFVMGKIEVLTTPKYCITIDGDNRLILVNNNINTANNASYLPVNLDSLSKVITKTTYSNLSNNLASYKISLKTTEYESLEVVFDKSDYHLHKIILVLRNYKDKDEDDERLSTKPRLEIAFSNFNSAPKFSQNLFSENRIVHIKGKTVSAQPSYSTYKVVSNLNRPKR